MKELTKQEIFNKVWTGLKSQGFEKSMDMGGSTCAYRSEGGRKCAAGWLIPDEVAKKLFTEDPKLNYKIIGGLKWFMQNFTDEQLEFIRELQRIHDDSVYVWSMEAELRGVARCNDLTVPEESNETPG